MVGSGVDVLTTAVDMYGVGRLVAVSMDNSVGWIVAGGNRVDVVVAEGIAVTCAQAVRKASMAQISNKRRGIPKLYRKQETPRLERPQ
jgi:hypothetical protein